jgi:hypothetical protein
LKIEWECRFCRRRFPVKNDATQHTVEDHGAVPDPPKPDQYLWEVWA